MSQSSRKAADYFQLLQVGITTRVKPETIVQAVRRMVNTLGGTSDFALVAADLKKAFYLCSRSAFLKAVQTYFP